jgi:hypothetical protein
LIYRSESAELRSASRRGLPALTNRLNAARWFPKKGDVVVTNGKRSGLALPLGADMQQEGIMPRRILPTQSKLTIGVDRRQLLGSAAVIATTGIVPGIAHSGAAKQTEVIDAVETSEILPACNVCAVTARRLAEIRRNQIRAEGGLPLLSITRELRRMKEAADAADFREFAAVHRKAFGTKF